MATENKIKCVLMDFEINQITLQEATDQILLLLNVVGRSEQLVCPDGMSGLTKHEYFAGLFLQNISQRVPVPSSFATGFLSKDEKNNLTKLREECTNLAIQLADDLLEALNKK